MNKQDDKQESGPAATHDGANKHPRPLGSQQAVAEKAADSKANVKARVDSNHTPDQPAKHHQHTPNSSGRK